MSMLSFIGGLFLLFRTRLRRANGPEFGPKQIPLHAHMTAARTIAPGNCT